MKILRFIKTIMKDILYTLSRLLIVISIFALIAIVMMLAITLFIIIPATIADMIFDCWVAEATTAIIGFLTLICFVDGINPIKAIVKDIKLIKKYIATKWNESGQS